MSFNTGLSGLRAAQMDLSVTGNNIANASTKGFKQSRAEFGDVYSASILGTGRNSVGSGVLVERISQQHTQGNIDYTDRALDMAIEGNGYFVLSDNGVKEYTRAGYFDLDKEGYVTNNTGKRLQGYSADLQGNIGGVMGDIQLTQTNVEPNATSKIDVELNLDSRKESLAFGTPTTIGITGVNISDTLNGSPAGPNDTINFINDGSGNPVPDSTLIEIDGVNYNLTGAGPDFTLTAVQNGANNPTVPADLDFTAASSGGVGTITSGADNDLSGFNPSDRTTYSDANQTAVYDSLGIEHVVTQYFIKVPASDPDDGNAWSMIVSFDGKFVREDGNAVEFPAGSGEYLNADNFNAWVTASPSHNPKDLAQQTVYFNAQGSLVGANAGFELDNTTVSNLSPSFDVEIPQQYLDGAWIGPTEGSNTFAYSMRGTTQYGASYSAQSQYQDGYTTGRLAGIEVSPDGTIFGRYTNGQNRAVGQVPLVTFRNPEGLKPNGSTAWLETSESGIPTTNKAGSGITGTIAGGALEESNVDLAEELVKMIIGQRNYQANAKTIQTQDTITQTIINLR